jgi:hypothetical protein
VWAVVAEEGGTTTAADANEISNDQFPYAKMQRKSTHTHIEHKKCALKIKKIIN